MKDMNIYELFDVLEEHSKFKHLNDSQNNVISAIWRTGDFELYDYRAGILQISFYPKLTERHYGLMSISTIDDGGWAAECNQELTIEKCWEIANNLQTSFGGILPMEAQLNDFLQKYGMYGTFTG